MLRWLSGWPVSATEPLILAKPNKHKKSRRNYVALATWMAGLRYRAAHPGQAQQHKKSRRNYVALAIWMAGLRYRAAHPGQAQQHQKSLRNYIALALWMAGLRYRAAHPRQAQQHKKSQRNYVELAIWMATHHTLYTFESDLLTNSCLQHQHGRQGSKCTSLQFTTIRRYLACTFPMTTPFPGLSPKSATTQKSSATKSRLPSDVL